MENPVREEEEGGREAAGGGPDGGSPRRRVEEEAIIALDENGFLVADEDNSGSESDDDWGEGDPVVQEVLRDLNCRDSIPLYRASWQVLTDDQIALLCESVTVTGQRKVSIFGGLSTPGSEALRKASMIVARMNQLRDLAVLTCPHDEEQAARVRPMIDAILLGLASAPKSQLRKLCLDSIGACAETWARFAGHCSNSLEEMGVAARFMTPEMADAVADSLTRDFQSLRQLSLEVGLHENERIMDRTVATTTRLLQSITSRSTASPSLRELRISFAAEDWPELGSAVAEQQQRRMLKEVATVSQACSLKSLTLQGPYIGGSPGWGQLELFQLFDLARTSLEELALEGFFFVSRGDLVQTSQMPRNHSVTKFTLSDCTIGEDCAEPLSCFKGVESIELYDTMQHDRSPRGPCSPMLGQFEKLEKLTSWGHFEDSDGPEDYDDYLASIASNLDISPSIRNVELVIGDKYASETLSSIERIVAGCRGSLFLRRVDQCNIQYLCTGILSAQSLAKLNLVSWHVSLKDVSAVLQSLQRNTSIQDFSGVFTIPSMSSSSRDEFSRELQVFVSSNNTLSSLRLAVENSGEGSGSRAETWFLVFLVRGLMHNQQLSGLSFHHGDGVDWAISNTPIDSSISSEIVDVLERHNTSLTTLEGLDYEDESHEERIKWLLTLNRYQKSILAQADTPAAVPLGLWPHVLGRIRSDDRVDVMYHFMNRLVRRSVVSVYDGANDAGLYSEADVPLAFRHHTRERSKKRKLDPPCSAGFDQQNL